MGLIIILIIPMIWWFILLLCIKGISYLVFLVIGDGVLNWIITTVIYLIASAAVYFVIERNDRMTAPFSSWFSIGSILAYAVYLFFEFKDVINDFVLKLFPFLKDCWVEMLQ